MPSRRVSPQGVALIQLFESFVPTVYLCPAGKQTIGYGHVIRPIDSIKPPISQEQALDLMRADLAPIETYLTGVLPGIPQCQFDALASFAYNVGLAALDNSTLLRKLKAGDVVGAGNAFGVWVYAKVSGKSVILDGLITRRAAERSMFMGAVV